MLALPGAVLVERHAFEVADVDVVEERLFHARHVAAAQHHVGGLERPAESRVDAELEGHLGELMAELLRLRSPVAVRVTGTLGSPFTRSARLSVEWA